MKEVSRLIEFIISLDGTGNKDSVKQKVVQEFNLVQDRSVFCCDSFALRFIWTDSQTPVNHAIITLSRLLKYDNKPFIVCIVTPSANRLTLGNTTFISKISHSSKGLTPDSIKGIVLGCDIMKEYQKIPNERDCLVKLYRYHQEANLQENISRIADTTF